MASTSRWDGTLLSQNCTNNTRFKGFTALAGSPTSWHFKDEDWRVAAAERACNSRVLTLWCFLQCETQDLATIKAIIHCSPPQEKKKNAGKKREKVNLQSKKLSINSTKYQLLTIFISYSISYISPHTRPSCWNIRLTHKCLKQYTYCFMLIILLLKKVEIYYKKIDQSFKYYYYY